MSDEENRSSAKEAKWKRRKEEAKGTFRARRKYLEMEIFNLDEETIDRLALIISIVVTGLGMFFNGAFLLAILKRTPPPLKSYAVLLFNFALVDFWASFGSMMSMQRLLFSGWAITYIFNGACQFVHPYVCYFFHCFNCHVFAHSQWILLISFIFRYWILVNPSPEPMNVIKLCVLVYIPSVIALAPYTLRNSPTEVIRNIMKSYYPDYDLDSVVVGGNATAMEWSAAIAVFYMCIPCPFVYSVILYYRQKTLDYLSKAACNLSAETKKSHRKMIKALTIQACIPVFYLIGATQYMLGTFHVISGPIFEHGTFMSMEMMPMLTPLISLYFITPYRKAMMDWFGLSKFQKTAAVAPVTSQGGQGTSVTKKEDPHATLADMA